MVHSGIHLWAQWPLLDRARAEGSVRSVPEPLLTGTNHSSERHLAPTFDSRLPFLDTLRFAANMALPNRNSHENEVMVSC
jgi:hypothetical protein